MSRKVLMLAALAVVSLVLAGCGGPAKVNVSMTTYAITADKSEVAAGEVTFAITNDATDQKHDFLIVKTDAASDDLPRTAENNVDPEQVEVIAESGEIEIGEAKDVTVTLTPGNYVLVCNLPGHYDQGMFVAFEVK